MLNGAQLQQENDQLKAALSATDNELSTTQDQLSQLKSYIEQLEQALIASRQQRFGPSSEKGQGQQLLLFDEAEETCQADAETDDPQESGSIAVGAHSRKKKGRKPLPASLPRVEVVHDLPDAQKVCAVHGVALQAAGEKVNEQLDLIPATVQVLRHIRKQYTCPCCDNGMMTATRPTDPIPKAQASPGTLAAIGVHKYADGLPLYRQVQMLKRMGIDLDRGTMAKWMVASGELIQPLLNLLRDRLLEETLVHVDETPVQVLREPGKAAQSKSYMWVQASGYASTYPVILFDYDPSRSGRVPKRLLTGYRGAIMVDGYEGYDSVCREGDITRLGCWAHVRRKFTEAAKVAGKKGKSAKTDYALKLIGKLYQIERHVKDLSSKDRHRIRQEQARPIIDTLHDWLIRTRPTVPPKLALGKALTYLHNQWPRLTGYLDEGNYPIDNNRVENAIRPFVIGRKGWLFSTSVDGARASANLYSLIETVKANKLNPYTYLKQVFTDLPNAETVEDIEALLPWNITDQSQ
jgi:transposase